MIFCAATAYFLIEAERKHPQSPARMRRDLDTLEERLRALENR